MRDYTITGRINTAVSPSQHAQPWCLTYSCRDACQVPKVEESVQPVVNIVPLQLLSYHLTCLRGFNVDQPRNLAKSVTVTEE